MSGIAASIGAWLFKAVTGDLFRKIIAVVAKTDDGAIRLKEIAAEIDIAQGKNDTEIAKALIAARAQAQQSKMNWPVFWWIIVAMMGPPLLMTWGVTVYNFLWWEHGIWPQRWAIADFPPSIKPWIQASIDWLYDPLGLTSGVGSALLAGRFARK